MHSNKPHLVNWNNVCLPKKYAGLGLRTARDCNRALIAKLGWHMLSRSNKPWCQAFTYKYLRSDSFLSCNPTPSFSATWRSILKCRDVLHLGIRWRVGSGVQIQLWHYVWASNSKLLDFALTRIPRHLIDLLVAAIIHNSEWNLAQLTRLLPDNLLHVIAAIPLPITSHLEDTMNKLIFEAQRIRPLIITQQASKLALETKLAFEAKATLTLKTPRWVNWTPPPQHFLKLNIDGSHDHSSGKTTTGGLLHDHCGCWHHGFVINVGIATSFLAKLWGCKEGVKLAVSLGVQQLILEMDSLLAIQLIQARKVSTGAASMLLSDIFFLLDSFTSCSVHHTLREGNATVDYMASVVHNLELGTTFFPTPPMGISLILQNDCTRTMFSRN
ncbi:hypothetical protein SLEP1_g26100 [Rubroshorea leprosula]|uniref:RNase H type-1 domain-containing protein n=1 Tax=Rubroshorea leprosula TaxID=152421 RepID=A0AAV5JL57_9ROSI|nr:hypothetical protein SLEP1_g26100 [Rubroshorea leprosula]